MIRKELWQRMREPRGWLILSLYLAALGAAVALAYFGEVSNVGFSSAREIQGAEIGVVVFSTVAVGQFALLLLLAPVFSGGSFTIEKEQRTLAALLTSLLTPVQIWWGKFSAAILYLALLLFASLPVLSLAFALGGIGPMEVLKITGMTLFLLAIFSAIGLWCSSYFRRSVHATAACYGIVIALTVLSIVVAVIQESLQQPGYGAAQPERPEFSPFFVNPFFPIFSVMIDFGSQPWYGLPVSLLFFAGMGTMAVALTLRNLERGGEQV